MKQITDKIHSIKNCYSTERHKEEAASKNSGSGRDDLYTSKWLFFQPLSFLRNNSIPRVTETNLKRKLKWNLSKILEKEKYLAQYLEKYQFNKKITQ